MCTLPIVLALAAAALPDQTGPWPPFEGVVVDAQGKPLGGVEVLLSYGQNLEGSVPVAARVRSDEAGRFRIVPHEMAGAARPYWPYAMVAAYVPGKALACESWPRTAKPSARLRLSVPAAAPQAVVVKRADGSPVAGARVAPVLVARPRSVGAFLPEEFVQRLVTETDRTGRAELPGLAAGDMIFALRVTGAAIGPHVVSFGANETGQETITVTIPQAGRLVGSVTSEKGQDVPAGTEVEVWSRTKSYGWTARVPQDGGPIRIAADGSFQTPPTLWQGQTYRIVARPKGFAPLLSSWVKLEASSAKVPPLVLKRLKSISGRVVDRQGRPVPGAQVLQAGDGPENSSTTTDAQGRFELGGYSLEAAFVLARKPGFRFGGRSIDIGATRREVEIVLTRVDEQPERSMPTLADPMPRDEMRALALRLLEPYLERALKEGAAAEKALPLRALVPLEPVLAVAR